MQLKIHYDAQQQSNQNRLEKTISTHQHDKHILVEAFKLQIFSVLDFYEY